MKFATSTALLALALAAPAVAQDEDTPPASGYFNGFYVGGTFALDATANDDEGGIAFDTNRNGAFDNTVTTTTGANAFSPGFCGGNALARTNTGCGDDKDSYGYAIRAGYDTRVGDGPFVAGLLVEAAKSESVDYVSAFSTTPASYTIGRQVDHNFALRGRLGVSPGDGRGLFYVTGGVAYGKIDHAFSTTNTANSFTETNDDRYELGGQVGAGAELYFMPNASVTFEYLYSSFDDNDYYVAVGQGSAPATNPFLLNGGGTNLRAADTDLDTHSFRVGLNFRF